MGLRKQELVFSTALLLLDAVAAFVNTELFFMISSLLIFNCFKKSFLPRERALILMFCILFLLLIGAGNIRFEFLSQAYALMKENKSLLFWIRRGHMHALRLLVAYPGYLLSYTSSVDLDACFTVYVGLIFELLYIITLKIRKLYVKEVWISGILMGVFLLVLSTVMSGRIIFAYLGLVIILYQDLSCERNQAMPLLRRWGWYAVGFLLTTVSSGTMVLTFGYMCLMFVIRFCFSMEKLEKWKTLAWGMLALTLLFPLWSRVLNYVLQMIEKNISFFGGGIQGIVGMLQHGIGKDFFVSDSRFYVVYFVLLIGTLTINFLLFCHLVVRKQKKLVPLYLAVNLGIYGFAVGISTGTMMMIPLILLILTRLSEERGEENVLFDRGSTSG